MNKFIDIYWKRNILFYARTLEYPPDSTESNERRIMKHLNYPLSWLIIFIRRICAFFHIAMHRIALYANSYCPAQAP